MDLVVVLGGTVYQKLHSRLVHDRVVQNLLTKVSNTRPASILTQVHNKDGWTEELLSYSNLDKNCKICSFNYLFASYNRRIHGDGDLSVTSIRINAHNSLSLQKNNKLLRHELRYSKIPMK